MCTGNSTIHAGTLTWMQEDTDMEWAGLWFGVFWSKTHTTCQAKTQHTSSFLGPRYFGIRALTLSRQRSELVGCGQKLAEENDGFCLQLFSKVQILISPFSMPPQVPERIYDTTHELLSHPLDSSCYHDDVCHLTLFGVIWHSPSSFCFFPVFPLVSRLQEPNF